MEDGKYPRQLRRSSRANETRTKSTTSPVEAKQLPSPEEQPPKFSKKRAASPIRAVNGFGRSHSNSPIGFSSSQNSQVIGTADLSGHVCLCQPEPKIPRPRNGMSSFSFLNR